MRSARSAIAAGAYYGHRSARTPPRRAARSDPRLFGRARPWRLETPSEKRSAISDDLRLFGSTFAAGFLFVSILIG